MESGDAAATDVHVLPTDDEIMEKAYDHSYTVPPGFYVDERADTARSYSVHHVIDALGAYELCTDSYDQALEWGSADNATRSVGGVYVGSYENDRYFEFIRELEFTDGAGNITVTTSPGYSRIFKCAYVNRDGVDRHRRDGYAGVLHRAARDGETVRDFVEYMWQFAFFWPSSMTVLRSSGKDLGNAYVHSLLLVFVTGQGTDQCDLLEIADWEFAVAKEDGRIDKKLTLLRQFEAIVDNGTPQKCAG